MKKIGGEIIRQAIEIGAKYVSDDGITFDSRWDCEQHEAALKRKEKEERYDKAYASVTSKQIGLNSATGETYLKTYNTKEEFLEDTKALSVYIKGLDSSVIIRGQYSKDHLPNFPATFVISCHETEYEDSCNTVNFFFYEKEDYIKLLQEDIDTIRKGVC